MSQTGHNTDAARPGFSRARWLLIAVLLSAITVILFTLGACPQGEIRRANDTLLIAA
jgi:hypothetical protein